VDRHGLPGWRGDGQEAGRQRLVDPGYDGRVQGVPEVAALTAASLMGAEAALDELIAASRAGGAGDLALEHQRTDVLLRGVGARRHIWVGQEGPQRRTQLEQVCAGVGRARALGLRAALQQQAFDAAAQGIEPSGAAVLPAPAQTASTRRRAGCGRSARPGRLVR